MEPRLHKGHVLSTMTGVHLLKAGRLTDRKLRLAAEQSCEVACGETAGHFAQKVPTAAEQRR